MARSIRLTLLLFRRLEATGERSMVIMCGELTLWSGGLGLGISLAPAPASSLACSIHVLLASCTKHNLLSGRLGYTEHLVVHIHSSCLHLLASFSSPVWLVSHRSIVCLILPVPEILFILCRPIGPKVTSVISLSSFSLAIQDCSPTTSVHPWAPDACLLVCSFISQLSTCNCTMRTESTST